jgi:putative membrane protein insertion efficiency factor
MNIIKKITIAGIENYQKISYVLWNVIPGRVLISGCRMVPTCSQYSIESIEKYGVIRGSFRSFLRILKCNPLLPRR